MDSLGRLRPDAPHRSKTHSVVLDVSIKINLGDNPVDKDYLLIREDNDLGFGRFNISVDEVRGVPTKIVNWDRTDSYLRCPLTIKPMESVKGRLEFLISHVMSVIIKTDVFDALDYKDALLIVKDYISQQEIQMNVPERTET